MTLQNSPFGGLDCAPYAVSASCDTLSKRDFDLFVPGLARVSLQSFHSIDHR